MNNLLISIAPCAWQGCSTYLLAGNRLFLTKGRSLLKGKEELEIGLGPL